MQFDKYMCVLVLGIALLLSMSSAAAFEGRKMTGNQWINKVAAAAKLSKTERPRNLERSAHVDGAAGMGFILGAIQDRSFTKKLPEDVKFNQVIFAVDNYFQDHPGKLHKPAIELIEKAIQEHF